MLFWRLTVKAKNILFIQRDKLRADRVTTHRMLGLWNWECTKTKKFKRSAIQWMCINYTEISVLGPWWNQTLHFIWRSTTSNLLFRGSRTTVPWFKAQAMGVNKLKSILKDICDAGGIPPKTNHAGRKKLKDNDVPPNQIIQIISHKNLQSINNYSSLRERQMDDISIILSSMASTNREVSEVLRGAFHFPVSTPPFQHYLLAASSSTLSVHENQLQTMFHGNAITGGVFNINMALSQSAVSSPESEPPKKKFRQVMCIESDSGSSKENWTWSWEQRVSNKVVKKWLWETLRLTFVSNICHHILYSAL